LAFCREKGLYFLDSRTTAETTAPAAARRLGIKIGERDVFIDNIQEKSSMIRYIDEGLVRAERRGHALMIGHTWSPELAPVLSELYPGFLEKGYSLSTASGLIMDSVD
ncbi:MAG: divergent polysaccharide deacetylase family protein, partial [Treponema sp.]|nr:divergent polysaccharide deacetylase family protein [Treponema sp.]